MDWSALLLDLIFTAAIYLFVPIIFCFACRKRLSNKQILTIAIVNGAVLWLIFTIIRINAGEDGTSGAVFLWSAIAYGLLRKNCLKAPNNDSEDETPQNQATPGDVLKKHAIITPAIHTLNHTETVKKSKKKPIIISTIIGVVIILISVLIAILVGINSDKEIHNVSLRTITISDEFKAKQLYSTWKNGKATEQSLVELMNKYGAEQGDQGAGRLYFVLPGEYIKEIDEWCFSPKRKVGDCAIIKNANGYSICYISDINFKPNYYIDFTDDNASSVNCLVVAVEPDFYPYSWEENGKFYGLHIDIAKEFSARNGFSLEFVPASWDDSFVGIQDGTYNLVLGIEPTEERQEAFSDTPVNFTDIYYDGMAAMYNVKEFDLSFDDWLKFKLTIKEMVEDGTIASYLSRYDLNS